MGLRIYIAGPYSKPDPVLNTNRAIAIATELLHKGHHPFVPHLTMFWNVMRPTITYEQWMEYDFAWVKMCDVVLRIPGLSPGADREVVLAASLHIPVVFGEVEQFDSYLDSLCLKIAQGPM